MNSTFFYHLVYEEDHSIYSASNIIKCNIKDLLIYIYYDCDKRGDNDSFKIIKDLPENPEDLTKEEIKKINETMSILTKDRVWSPDRLYVYDCDKKLSYMNLYSAIIDPL